MVHEKSEDQILSEMQETRVSLTEKLETLEKKVTGAVENATFAVNETVGVIKDSVQETVATVNESVRDGVESVKGVLDLPAHVQEHPWLMLGGSVAAGYFLGRVLTPEPRQQYAPPAITAFPAPPPVSAPAPAQSFLAPEIAKIKGLALGVLFGAAREMIRSAVPEHLGEKIDEIVDAVTKKAGGEPVPSEDFAQWTAPHDDERQDETPVGGSNEQQRPAKQHGNGHSAPRRW